jgi:transposase
MLVGIDVSLQDHQVQIMGKNGNSFSRFSVPSTRPGADTLIERMMTAAEKKQSQTLRIGMEATNNLGWHLAALSGRPTSRIPPKISSHVYVLNARKIARFKLAKYDGLVWHCQQSGKFEAEETQRMPGNKYLRYYLVQAADQLHKTTANYRAFYQKKYKEVPKHQHKRALVLTARKLVRLVFSLLSTRQLYIPPERR